MRMKNTDSTSWQQKRPEVFWAEISPCEHLIQIYEDDDAFLNSLEAFVHAGIQSEEVTIVIATPPHLAALESRLRLAGLDLDAALASDLYIPLDATKALEKFMVYGTPDKILFNRFITGLIERAAGRRIRAFGEMVALLWGQGFKNATVKLEELWNSFCHSGAFCLFCAYPKIGFEQDAKLSIDEICHKHSMVVAGWSQPAADHVYYKNRAEQNSEVA